MSDNLLTLREAAKRLSVQPETLRRWERAGKIASIRIGKRGDRRFETTEIDRFIRASQKDNMAEVKNDAVRNQAFTNEVKEKFTGRQCYHQRFDGSPLLLTFVGGAETWLEDRKPDQTAARWRFCFYGDGKADWFLDQEDIDRGAQAIIKLSQTSNQVGKDLMKKWKHDEDAFEAYFHNFAAKNLEQMTDQQLASEFEEFKTLIMRRFSSSAIIDHFALGTDQLISDLLKKETGPYASESDFHHVFSIATAPVHQSFITEAELAILEVATQVAEGAQLRSPAIQEAIADLQRRYYWMQNNYIAGKLLDRQHFENEIRTWLDSGKNLREEIEKISQTPEVNKQRKADFYTKHHLSEKLVRLLTVSEDFTRWQDERKRATYFSADITTKLLTEMGRRRQTEEVLLKYLMPSEVKEWFLRKTITRNQLKERAKSSVTFLTAQREEIYSGPVADEIRTLLLGKHTDQEVMDIRGLVACTGKAVGTAKIVLSSREIDKVEEGDILVAVMTRPDYVPAMKRAAAIVTDEGGITSHAAIVSRELGVPCIIGAKIATRVFKDGDLVEVNANHNWVRKLQTR